MSALYQKKSFQFIDIEDQRLCDTVSSLLLEGLISKNRTSSLDKDLSGMTLRDLWDNSSNNVNKPLAPPLGLSVSRANVGKDNLLKESC